MTARVTSLGDGCEGFARAGGGPGAGAGTGSASREPECGGGAAIVSVALKSEG